MEVEFGTRDWVQFLAMTHMAHQFLVRELEEAIQEAKRRGRALRARRLEEELIRISAN